MTMSGFNRIGLNKQDCQQAAATRNGRKSEHHPWATSRHLAGIVSVLSGHSMLCTTSCPEFRNLGPGSLPLLSIDRGLCPAELMQTICIFANFFVKVETIPSKLSQGFVPVIAAKTTVLVIIVG